MNTKAAIGIIAALIILAGVFFVLNRPSTPPAFAPATATSTGATASTSPVKIAPASAVNTAPAHKPSVTVVRTSAFDQASLTSSSPRPIITGTANVDHVGIVVTNSAGVGIAGSYEIPVKDGKWSFSAPQTLPPGNYTLSLIDGGDILTATLTVAY